MHELIHYLQHRRHYSELGELYFSEAVRAFALSFVGIFVPVFLYTEGFSITAILGFYALHNLVRLLFQIPTAKLIARLGAKHIIALSYIFSFVFFVGLANHQTLPLTLPLLALIHGLAENLHWTAFHCDFSKVHNKGLGRELSYMSILVSVAAALGPLAGGFLASLFGLKLLFISIPLLLLVAALMLFMTAEVVKEPQFDWRRIFRVPLRNMISYAASGMDEIVYAVSWPLFIFIIFGSLLRVGAITSVAFVLSVLAALVVGRLSDRSSKKKLVLMGTSLVSLLNLARIFATTLPVAFVVGMLGNLSNTLAHIPYIAMVYKRAETTDRIEQVAAREMAVSIGRGSVTGVLFLLSWQLSARSLLMGAFIMAAVLVTGMNSIKE